MDPLTASASRVSHALLLWTLLVVALVAVFGLIAWMAARRAARWRAEQAQRRGDEAERVDAWSESARRLRPEEPPAGTSNLPDA